MGSKLISRSSQSSAISWVLFAILFPFCSTIAGVATLHGTISTEPTPQCAQILAKRTVAIVDAFSSGVRLAQLYLKEGHRLIHVRSEYPVDEAILSSFRPTDFAERDLWSLVSFDGGVEALAAALKREGVSYAVAGAETGVELADFINEKLGVHFNGTRLSRARRDKLLMQRHLESLGLPYIKTQVADSLEDILSFVQNENGGNWPVIIKPRSSSGGDGFTVLSSYEDAVRDFPILYERLKRTGNKLGVPDDVLVQEFLSGPETVVDTYASHGRQLAWYAVDYLKESKKNANGTESRIYGVDQLRNLHSAELAGLKELAFSVSKAFDTRFGPAHMEFIFSSKGPVLVEIGTRLPGVIPRLVSAATGIDPVDVTYLAYEKPELFSALANELESGRHATKAWPHAWIIQLISHQPGTLAQLPYLEALKGLPGFKESESRLPRIGHKMVRTDGSVFESPGELIFVHPELDVLKGNLQLIRHWEENGFYVVEDGANLSPETP